MSNAEAYARQETKRNCSELIREYFYNNPEATNNQCAKELNCAAKYVRTERSREKKRQERGKGLTIGWNTNASEYDALSYHCIPENIRNYLLERFGDLGVFVSYLLSNGLTEYISLSQLILSACHPDSRRHILRGKRPPKVLSQKFLRLLDSNRPFLLDIQRPIKKSRPRHCKDFLLPGDVLDKIEALQAESSRLVNVFSGRAFRDTRTPEPCSEPEIEKVRLGLMAQTLDYDSLIERNLPRALAKLEKIRPDRENFILTYSHLSRVKGSPTPVYSGKAKTQRIYPEGLNLLNLRREIRETLFHGKLQFDLQHAQFSIVSTLWDDEDLKKRAKSGSLWRDLVSSTGLPKEVVKTMLYAMLFGANLGEAMHAVVEKKLRYGYTELREALRKEPLFEQLDRASKAFSERIRANSSCIDAYGNELHPSGKKATESDIRSMKAVHAQSYEVAIMAPVVQYLLDQKAPIWLFLHDGLILDPECDVHFEECSRIAREKAASFGIDIVLSKEVLGEDGQQPAAPSLPGEEAA